MKKRILQLINKNSVYILCGLMPVVFFGIIGSLSKTPTIEQDIVDEQVFDYNDNWKVLDGEKELPVENLPVKLSVGRGDIYTVVNTLPGGLADDMVLAIHGSRQLGEVYIEGKLVFSFAEELRSVFAKYPISKIFYVPLKASYSGKEIVMKLQSYVPEYSGRIDEMYYGDAADCVKVELASKISLFFLYLFLCFIGIILLLVFLLIKKQRSQYLEIMLMGITTIVIAVQVIAENNMIQSFTYSNNIVNTIAICSKLVLPFPCIGYFYLVSQRNITRKVMKIAAYVFGVISVLTIVAHQFGIVDFSFSLSLYTILVILVFGLNIILIIIDVCVDYNYSLIPVFIASHILMFTILVEIFSYFQYIVSYKNFGVFFGAGLVCYLFVMGLVSTNRIIDMFDENRKMREELLESRVELMLSQIQPHFVYNTLNSIQALIDSNPVKASMMIHDFSKYLRAHVDTIGREGLISFEEELNNVKTYVAIELMRFPKLTVTYAIEEKQFLIPALSIQPIVENAIRHGISKKLSGGCVHIKSYQTRESYIIEIIDDGVGFEKTVKGKGTNLNRSVGIKNITYRLNQIMNAGVIYDSAVGEGTSVKVFIPKEKGAIHEDNFS